MTKIIRWGHGNLKGEFNPEDGQLFSLISDGIEYFHDGGKPSFNGPGWKNSEIIPYPICGPAIHPKVKFDGKTFLLDQHGISRFTKENPFVPQDQKK